MNIIHTRAVEWRFAFLKSFLWLHDYETESTTMYILEWLLSSSVMH